MNSGAVYSMNKFLRKEIVHRQLVQKEVSKTIIGDLMKAMGNVSHVFDERLLHKVLSFSSRQAIQDRLKIKMQNNKCNIMNVNGMKIRLLEELNKIGVSKFHPLVGCWRADASSITSFFNFHMIAQ